MSKKSKFFSVIGYIYVVLPILIFLIGWCNPLTAIIGSGITLYCLFLAIKNAPEIWFPENKKQIFFVISVFFISLIWVYSSGIGALVFQNWDHNVRNPIFEMLVSQSWPALHTNEPAILTYYIGFWLPSAVAGKIFNSIQIGYYFQIFWAATGVFLFFYYVLSVLRKKNYFPIILFIFFSGLDYLGSCLTLSMTKISSPISHLEWWAQVYQYSSMTTQLFWVFNQAIAAWLLVALFCLEKNNKNIGFLYSCLFIHSTLPAIGMLPLIIYWVLKNGQRKITLSGIKNSLKSVFSIQNVAGALTISVISYFYLSANLSANVSSSISQAAASKNWLLCLIWLLVFFMIEVGFYLCFLYKIYAKKIIFYIVTICFLIYPLIKIGSAADFCMRASIPILVILYLMICKAFENRYFVKKCELAFTSLIITLCIGAITPVHEFTRTIYYTGLGVTKIKSDLGYNNFFGLEKDNKFLKYFGKQPKRK